MGERRASILGEADFMNLLRGPLYPGFYSRGPITHKEKEKYQKHYDKEFEENEMDQLVQQKREVHSEPFEEIERDWPSDNVSYRQGKHLNYRLKKGIPQPHFTDFKSSAYCTSFDKQYYNKWRWYSWKHCIGNLGEDHPTCKKAQWYVDVSMTPAFKQFYEDMEELGHWDTMTKWGLKPYPQFLPLYQPVKKNIPGAYEYYNSTWFLERNANDGSKDGMWPVVVME